MRWSLYLVLALGAGALGVVLLAWLAERRLDREAARDSFSDLDKVPIADVALVLGASPIGPEGGPNRYLVYRLDAAAAVWKAGKVKYLIASGGDDEPEAMRDGLIARGVPRTAIYLDGAGLRTHDSVLRARDVFGQKRLLIVSQRFHLGRALYIAHGADLEAWGFNARDVDQPYSVTTELRRFPSALRAMWDVAIGAPAREAGKPVTVGIDPAG